MKKIQKLKLHDVVELSNSEMSQLWGGYEGFNGAWFRCICSKPRTYAMRPDAVATPIVQAENIIEAVRKLQEGDCYMFYNVSCTFDKYF